MLSHWLHWCVFSPVCIFICFIKWHLYAKALSHWLHWCGFSPACVLKCSVRLFTYVPITWKWLLPSVHSLVLYKIKLFQKNTWCHDHMKMVLLQCVYFLMLYKTICSVNIRYFLCENLVTLELMHFYGFSPLCIFIWFLRVLFSAKSLLQCLHWYGFSPVCAIICSLRWLLYVKAF